MKAPIPRPTLRLVDKVSRSCGHTPGKVAGQRATVKAEMNGVTPGLDRRPPPRWMGGQGGQSLKVLVRALSDFEVFSFSKLNNQNKFFRLKKFYLLSRSEEHTSELQSRFDLVCRLLLEKTKIHN